MSASQGNYDPASVDQTSSGSDAPLPSPQAWRESGEYLPTFMQDFHDQKDLFKALQDVVERSNAKQGPHRSLNATWTEYHIYTVDIFLWVLANHGYTLQRSRRRLAFSDIWAFVADARERARALSASVLKSAFGGDR